MENEIYQIYKTKRIYQTYLSMSIWKFFTISTLAMRKSAKKQQSPAGSDLPIGYVGLGLGLRDPRGPPANCGAIVSIAGI